MNNIIAGMPIVDKAGESIGTTSRVHPEYCFTHPEGGLIIYARWVGEVTDGVVHLKVLASSVRQEARNRRRIAS